MIRLVCSDWQLRRCSDVSTSSVCCGALSCTPFCCWAHKQDEQHIASIIDLSLCDLRCSSFPTQHKCISVCELCQCGFSYPLLLLSIFLLLPSSFLRERDRIMLWYEAAHTHLQSLLARTQAAWSSLLHSASSPSPSSSPSPPPSQGQVQELSMLSVVEAYGVQLLLVLVLAMMIRAVYRKITAPLIRQPRQFFSHKSSRFEGV